MRLLSLDQSSKISGWAIFQDGKLEKYGKWTFNDSDLGARLFKIRKALIKIIQEEQIDEVVIEDIQLQENVQLFKTLAEVFGVVYETVIELDLPVSAVLAAQWKSTLNIKGKQRAEQKRNAQQYIINNYGIKPTQDECDAICIGLHYLNQKNSILDWSD